MIPTPRSAWSVLLHATCLVLLVALPCRADAKSHEPGLPVSAPETGVHTEVHTYFVAGDPNAPAVWVHNRCVQAANRLREMRMQMGMPARDYGRHGFPNSPYFHRTWQGRPNPHFSINTTRFTSGEGTARGGIRNAQQFWEYWSHLRLDTISPSNRYLIENHARLRVSPRVDRTWLRAFPEHSRNMGETIVHHHVDQGPIAIPVPSSLHVGSGGPFHGFPLPGW